MLSSIDKLNELKHFYTNTELAARLGVSVSSIDKRTPPLSETLQASIESVFEAHCMVHSEDVDVADLHTYAPENISLVSTPDGFQMIMKHWIKQPRAIYQLATTDGHSLKCSDDHLVEMSDGWVFARDLKLGDYVLTKTGLQEVIEHSQLDGEQVVYDFEVGHENHRYWSGGISSHNTGKSFIAGNVIREAQRAGAFNLIIDSENALDEDYLTKVGVDYNNGILRKRVVKITDTWSLLRAFLDGYVADYGDDLANAPKVHITIDSLGFLVTDSDYDNANDGTYKADQGATKRMIKDLLKKLTHAIAGMNITYLCTDQVYQARSEQIMAGTAINGAVLNEQVKFAFHQIAYLSRLKLKDDKTKEITGIRLKVAAAKTRYTRPFGQIELEVPYETGIDPYNGLLEVAMSLGIVQRKGARYVIDGQENTWYGKDFATVAEEVLERCAALKDASIHVDTGLEQADIEKATPFGNQKRLIADLADLDD